MSIGTSLRDIASIARFEVLRAIRTWRALALTLLVLVAATGGASIFVLLIGALEDAMAETLGVPATSTPGAMLDALVRESNAFREVIGAMVGDESLVDHVLQYPVVAIYHLWFMLLIVPFFAASAAAESLSIDMGSRALRFEVLRTGRMELLFGRAIGQVLLAGLATLLACVGVFAVSQLMMTGQPIVWTAASLIWLSPRAIVFGLPFVALGVACSALTTSPAWARVLAISLTAGSYLLLALLRWASHLGWAAPVEALELLLPQHWVSGLWRPGGAPWVSAGVLLGLALTALIPGLVRFQGRDL